MVALAKSLAVKRVIVRENSEPNDVYIASNAS